jgi:glycosyltransferase involved in cell wall biosynthesis
VQRNLSRILMTTDTVGGVWNYSIELASQLQNHQIEVALATMGAPPNDHQRKQANRLSNITLFESDFKLEWMEDPWSDLELAKDWLLKLQRLWQPQLVHLNQFAFGSLSWNVPVVVVAHSCVLSWWQAIHDSTAPESWNAYRDLVQSGLNAASAIVTPSEWMRKEVQRIYGCNGDVNVIRNGRSSKDFRKGPKHPMILSVGRLWDPAKNISLIAEIADSISWPIYVAGQSHGSNVFDKTNIKYFGVVGAELLQELFASASIYCLPARYEPFGLSILEAALSRSALVLGDIPSLRELWNGAAMFVQPDNKQELKEAIELLIKSPLVRDELERAAHTRALQYSAESMAEKYLHLYNSLIYENDQIAS